MINKMDKHGARLMKKKRERTQFVNIVNERLTLQILQTLKE